MGEPSQEISVPNDLDTHQCHNEAPAGNIPAENSSKHNNETESASKIPAATVVTLSALAAGCSSQSSVVMPEEPVPCDPAAGSDCGPVTTEFQQVIDKEIRTRFLRQDESRFIDWMKIALASSNIARINNTKAIINLMKQNSRISLGFPVNNLHHCLQTATRAVRDNAGDDLVLAALVHDIGIAISYPGHAQISAAIIRPIVPDPVYRVVLHHHEFELAHYGHLIGEPTDMRNLYEAEPWYDMAADFVDNWVQTSYDPGYKTLPLDEFIPLIEQRFSSFKPSDLEITMADCFVETTP